MEPSAAEVTLLDPLSNVTRAERRSLLAVSAVALATRYAGLVPTKISALGIEFQQADQQRLLWSLAGLVAYFLLAFAAYALSDFVAWKLRYNEHFDRMVEDGRERRQRIERLPILERGIHDVIREDYSRWARVAPPVSVGRSAVDFVLPLAVAVWAIVVLV